MSPRKRSGASIAGGVVLILCGSFFVGIVSGITHQPSSALNAHSLTGLVGSVLALGGRVYLHPLSQWRACASGPPNMIRAAPMLRLFLVVGLAMGLAGVVSIVLRLVKMIAMAIFVLKSRAS